MISAYRPGKNKLEFGSVWNQHCRYFSEHRNIANPDPHTIFGEELLEEVRVRMNMGDSVVFDFRTIEVPRDEEDVFVNEVPELFPTVCRNEDVDVMECFLNLPALREMHNPVTVVNIQNHQAADQHLIASRLRQYQHFPIKVINR